MAWFDQLSRNAMAKASLGRSARIASDAQSVARARLERRDKLNTQQMKSIIRQHGWPGRSLVGNMGAQMAWLLVQHAVHDLDFQRECLELMQDAVERGEAEAAHQGYLVDRIRVVEGRPQLYGTQVDEAMNAFPIENGAHVDKRRAEVDLEPLSQYLSRMREWNTDEAD